MAFIEDLKDEDIANLKPLTKLQVLNLNVRSSSFNLTPNIFPFRPSSPGNDIGNLKPPTKLQVLNLNVCRRRRHLFPCNHSGLALFTPSCYLCPRTVRLSNAVALARLACVASVVELGWQQLVLVPLCVRWFPTRCVSRLARGKT